jgi:hypothetical protein
MFRFIAMHYTTANRILRSTDFILGPIERKIARILGGEKIVDRITRTTRLVAGPGREEVRSLHR